MISIILKKFTLKQFQVNNTIIFLYQFYEPLDAEEMASFCLLKTPIKLVQLLGNSQAVVQKVFS